VAQTLIAFPNDPMKRVRLPRYPGPEGLGTWRFASCLDQTVPISNPAAPGGTTDFADADGYFPVEAVYLECLAVQQPLCGAKVNPAFLNDGISRASVWLDQVRSTDGNPIANAQAIDFRVKFSDLVMPEVVAQGTIVVPQDTPQRITPYGLIVTTSGGAIAPQVELWARVRLQEAPVAIPLVVRVAFTVDRNGDQMHNFLGRIAGGPGFLPPTV
jgi:hypothetical protein